MIWDKFKPKEAVLAKKDDVQAQLSELLADDVDDDNGDDDDNGEVTEEDIRKMKKAELIAFIDEEGLDIDNPKTTKVSELRDAVVEAFFEESDEEEDDEDEDSSDDDEEEEDDDEEDDDDDDEDDEEEEEKLTYEFVMEADADDLDTIATNEGVKVKKKVRKSIDKYRAAIVKALELEAEEEEDDDEEEEEKPKAKAKAKRQPSAAKQTVYSVAAENTSKPKKVKLVKTPPFQENSKRYHASVVMMQESRTAEDHQAAASKSHRKAGINRSKEYQNVIDANFIRIVAGVGGVFAVDDEEDAIKLLGFVPTSKANDEDEAPAETTKPTGKKKKKSKKSK